MSGPAEPSYPLTREQFRRALATGHGRAKIHVERFGASEFRDEILEAATVNLVSDPQVNGTRGEWLAELCLAAGVAETVIAQPIPEDHHDREQRVALMLAFARRGIAGARSALYACLGRARGSSDVYASREIIELDGEAGLLFVARAMGSLLATEADFSVWGYELSVFDEQHGEGRGRALLEREAASDASIRVYLEHVTRYEAGLAEARQAASGDDARPGRPARARMSVQEALRIISESTPGKAEEGLTYWGRLAEPEELQQVLGLLLLSSNPRVQESALRALSGPDHPPLHARVLELTRHADDEVRFWAGRVLSKHSRADIRELGLEALARGDAQVGLQILRSSAQAEDADALLRALVSLRGADPYRLHSAEFDSARDARGLSRPAGRRARARDLRAERVCALSGPGIRAAPGAEGLSAVGDRRMRARRNGVDPRAGRAGTPEGGGRPLGLAREGACGLPVDNARPYPREEPAWVCSTPSRRSHTSTSAPRPSPRSARSRPRWRRRRCSSCVRSA